MTLCSTRKFKEAALYQTDSGTTAASAGSSLAPDVDPTNSYCKFANFLMANGVMPKSPDVVDNMNGCATGNFCGTATVTRADMAVYMARAIGGRDAQVPTKYSNAEAGRSYDIATPSTLVFTDAAANAQMGSVQYAKHVYYLWALNVVSGTSNTTYSPANSVTRGQMATFLAVGFHLPRRPATGAAYADGITYATNGTIASVVHGDGTTDVVERDPNSIARPAAIKTYGAPITYSSGNYAYDGASNIKTIGPDHFYYDLASRLTEGTTSAGTKAQQLAYDAYGNITSRTNNGTNTGYTIQASTNRATAVGGTSWGYDGAGDVTSIGTTTYGYDPLGMMTTLTAPAFTSYYFYTPDDERIWTKTGSGSSWASTWTVRGTDAKVLREMTSTATTNTGTDANYSWKKDYVYRDGLLLAAITGTDTEHFHLDHLGTPRLITYLNGTASAERHDYYPFGEEVSLAGNEEMKFTGHERDGNSGLDYMHARFGNPAVGRFLAVDSKTGTPVRPETFNRYAYSGNSPINKYDPNGREEITFTLRTYIPFPDVSVLHPIGLVRVFAGDGYDGNRGTHRVLQTVTIETDRSVSKNPIIRSSQDIGTTHELGDNGKILNSARATHAGSITATRDIGGNALINITTAATNPLVSFAPAINSSINISVTPQGGTVTANGTLDGFPAVTLSMTRSDGATTEVFSFDPRTAGTGAFALFPGEGDQSVDAQCKHDECEADIRPVGDTK